MKLAVTIIIVVITTGIAVSGLGFTSLKTNNVPSVVAQEQKQEQKSMAAILYENKSLTFPSSIKHIIILIPNEAHESTNQSENQWPLVNQPYLPQRAIVNPGTMVVWFNGDVDHDHKISLINSGNSKKVLFDSGIVEFNEASKPFVLNNPGTFSYYEANVNEEDKDFVMNGEIVATTTAVAAEEQQQHRQDPSIPINTQTSDTTNPQNSTLASNLKPDTAGVLMVPTQDTQKYSKDLESRGLTIDSMYNFQDLRGGQKGTGPEQTLIAWTAISGTNLNNLLSTLQQITSDLPYS